MEESNDLNQNFGVSIPCPWMRVPESVRYPRRKSSKTLPRAMICMKDLVEKQNKGEILWFPIDGTLLQTVGMGGSHGFVDDDDVDIMLVSTLNLSADDYCSNDALGLDKQHFWKVKNVYVIIRNIRGCVTHNYLATSFVLAFLGWQVC